MKRTTTEAELRQWASEGKSQSEIAELLGQQKSYVTGACILLGIKTRGLKGAARRIDTAQCVALMRRGLTIKEIAVEIGSSHRGVRHALVRDSLPTSTRKLLRAEAAQANQA